MTNFQRIATNTVVQVASRILTAAISLVAIGYLTRYLGVEGYGKYNLIVAYLGLFGVIVDFGFFLLQVRAVVNNPNREGFVLGNFTALKLALSVIAGIAAFFVARVTFNDPIILAGILAGAISQLSISFLHIPNSLFQARLEMWVVAISNVISRLIYAVVIIWATQVHASLLDMVWLVSATNLLNLIVMMTIAYRTIKLRLYWDWAYIKSIIIDAIPIGTTTVLAMIYFRIDTVMLGYLADSYAVGIYTTPYKILDVFLTIPVIFMSSVFPVMTQALKEGHDHMQRIYSKAFNYSAIIAGPILAGGFVLAGPIISLLAGRGYEESVPVLQILVWVAALSFFGAVLTYTVIAAGKQQQLVIPYLAATIFNVIANYFAIPRFGYIGASYITIATELLVVLGASYVVVRHLKLYPTGRQWLVGVLATIIMATVMWPLREYNFLLVGIFGSLIYLLVLILFKVVSINSLRRIIHR